MVGWIHRTNDPGKAKKSVQVRFLLLVNKQGMNMDVLCFSQLTVKKDRVHAAGLSLR